MIPVVLGSIVINIPRWFELMIIERHVDILTGQIVNVTNADLASEQQGPGSNTTSFNTSPNGTELVVGIAGTWLRYNKYYVNYYLNWTLLLVTGILPLTALGFLNTRIYRRIKEVQKIRTTATSHG